jgi:hypothetical protein
MTTYTINNTTANSGTITLNTVAGFNGTTIGSGVLGHGQIYTTTGTGTASWISPNNYDQVLTVNAGKDTPTLEVKGNMVINGVDLEERLNTIEKVLQIPERDVRLEKKHPKLAKLYHEYINELAKYRMWHAIKGEEDGTT